jgi:exonuclease VII small subunit
VAMADYILNSHELSQYGLLRSQVLKLDESIREAKDELEEINQYNISVSPVLTGMPSGNEKRDKIAEFIIRLENDRQRLNSSIASFETERDVIKYRLKKIREAVNKITNKQLRDIVIWHYFEGLSIREVAGKSFLTENAVYKRINRLFS